MSRPMGLLDGHPTHTCVLVPSLEQACEALGQMVDVTFEPIEVHAPDGMREVYVGPADRTHRLLLVEPADATGPYARALDRRGPGVHHVGMQVGALSATLHAIGGTGWLLLPQSVETMSTRRTAWLTHRSVPALVELYEHADPEPAVPFVETIELPLGADGETACGPRSAIRRSPDGRARMTIQGQRIALDSLWTAPKP